MAEARSALVEALAAEIGAAPLTETEIDSVLELASVAAHGSGDRTSAPLATFLAGIAVAGGGGDRAAVVDGLRERAARLTESPEA